MEDILQSLADSNVMLSSVIDDLELNVDEHDFVDEEVITDFESFLSTNPTKEKLNDKFLEVASEATLATTAKLSIMYLEKACN